MRYIIESKLTLRQWQCVTYLVQGISFKNIASKLNLSPRTIEHYIDNLKKRFKRKNKIELLRYLFLTHNCLAKTYSVDVGFINDIYDTLPEKQKNYINYLLKGMTYKEISSLVGLSPRTIEFYIQNLKRKFNCRSKVELIMKLSLSLP